MLLLGRKSSLSCKWSVALLFLRGIRFTWFIESLGTTCCQFIEYSASFFLVLFFVVSRRAISLISRIPSKNKKVNKNLVSLSFRILLSPQKSWDHISPHELWWFVLMILPFLDLKRHSEKKDSFSCLMRQLMLENPRPGEIYEIKNILSYFQRERPSSLIWGNILKFSTSKTPLWTSTFIIRPQSTTMIFSCSSTSHEISISISWQVFHFSRHFRCSDTSLSIISLNSCKKYQRTIWYRKFSCSYCYVFSQTRRVPERFFLSSNL